MIDLDPVIAEYALRPKRKYTVTERVVAACRANLEHANAVPREIRFRSTEKQRRACHHNLTLALIAKKRDCSSRYATCFRNGWYVADSERKMRRLCLLFATKTKRGHFSEERSHQVTDSKGTSVFHRAAKPLGY
jgi:hypothetical protein